MPSHGSLTKAGKVRNQTPKIKAKPRKNLAPRIRNRKEHIRYLARRLVPVIVKTARKHGISIENVINEKLKEAISKEEREALLYLLRNPRVIKM